MTRYVASVRMRWGDCEMASIVRNFAVLGEAVAWVERDCHYGRIFCAETGVVVYEKPLTPPVTS